MLKNYMEEVVDNSLQKIIKEKQVCNCDKCIKDIKAIALNNLKPLYVVTDEGLLFSKMKEFQVQFNTDVLNQLLKAIEIVSQNPKHA